MAAEESKTSLEREKGRNRYTERDIACIYLQVTISMKYQTTEEDRQREIKRWEEKKEDACRR